jgi:hypothetical protein
MLYAGRQKLENGSPLGNLHLLHAMPQQHPILKLCCQYMCHTENDMSCLAALACMPTAPPNISLRTFNYTSCLFSGASCQAYAWSSLLTRSPSSCGLTYPPCWLTYSASSRQWTRCKCWWDSLMCDLDLVKSHIVHACASIQCLCAHGILQVMLCSACANMSIPLSVR